MFERFFPDEDRSEEAAREALAARSPLNNVEAAKAYSAILWEDIENEAVYLPLNKETSRKPSNTVHDNAAVLKANQYVSMSNPPTMRKFPVIANDSRCTA